MESEDENDRELESERERVMGEKRDLLRSFAQWSLASLSVLSKRSGPRRGGRQKMDESALWEGEVLVSIFSSLICACITKQSIMHRIE